MTSDLFAAMFVRAAHDAARHHGYGSPGDEVIAEFLARIPDATQSEIGRGVAEGMVRQSSRGHQFRLTRLGEQKGPYSWFSANRAAGLPDPNWEYFFQVAEYLRLARVLPSAYLVGFEDVLMDISVRDDRSLLWYVEVKAKPTMIEPLLRSLHDHGQRVYLEAPDRGLDALRKAKYLVRYQPRYLSIVGGETRRHFHVDVLGNAFRLRELTESPEFALGA